MVSCLHGVSPSPHFSHVWTGSLSPARAYTQIYSFHSSWEKNCKIFHQSVKYMNSQQRVSLFSLNLKDNEIERQIAEIEKILLAPLEEFAFSDAALYSRNSDEENVMSNEEKNRLIYEK